MGIEEISDSTVEGQNLNYKPPIGAVKGSTEAGKGFINTDSSIGGRTGSTVEGQNLNYWLRKLPGFQEPSQEVLDDKEKHRSVSETPEPSWIKPLPTEHIEDSLDKQGQFLGYSRGEILENIGVKLVVRLDTGENLDGWLYGRTANGLYVALDRQGRFIRFVPKGQLTSITYLQKEPRPEFAEFVSVQRGEVEALARNLEQPMRHTFDRLDYNRIRKIGSTLHSSRDVLNNPDALSLPGIGERLLATRDAYEDLLDETEQSGVASVLREWQEQLRSVMSPSILPVNDFELASPDEIDDMIETARKSELPGVDFDRSNLDKLSPPVIFLFLGGGEVKRPANQPRRPDKLGWLKKWSKVALGGSFAASNLALGVVAAIGIIPTLGAVVLPSALTIAGSVYLGLSSASKSLHEVNASIEDEEDRVE